MIVVRPWRSPADAIAILNNTRMHNNAVNVINAIEGGFFVTLVVGIMDSRDETIDLFVKSSTGW